MGLVDKARLVGDAPERLADVLHAHTHWSNAGQTGQTLVKCPTPFWSSSVPLPLPSELGMNKPVIVSMHAQLH